MQDVLKDQRDRPDHLAQPERMALLASPDLRDLPVNQAR